MTREDILEIIIQHTCHVLPILKDHVFKKTDRLKDLGANSLDRSEIIELTMEALSMQIPRIEVFGAKDIGELADLIYRQELQQHQLKHSLKGS